MIPIAVLASGRGTNFEALARRVREKELAAEIVAVVSDRPDAPVVGKARASGVRAIVVAPDAGSKSLPADERRRLHDEKVLEALRPFAPRFLVMAGYMRVVSPLLLEAFRSERGYARVTNVHPSLLPAFPGVASYRQAYEHGAQVAGVSVHLVENEVDGGPILAQQAFAIADCRTADEVEARGLEIEHRLYGDTLSWVLPEKFTVERRGTPGRLCVRAN